jgi:hypothetical protein
MIIDDSSFTAKLSTKDGVYDLEVTYKDENGKDVTISCTADNEDDLINGAIDEIIAKITPEEEDKKEVSSEEYIEQLEEEIDSLRIDNDILVKRTNDLIADIKKMKVINKRLKQENAQLARNNHYEYFRKLRDFF